MLFKSHVNDDTHEYMKSITIKSELVLKCQWRNYYVIYIIYVKYTTKTYDVVKAFQIGISKYTN